MKQQTNQSADSKTLDELLTLGREHRSMYSRRYPRILQELLAFSGRNTFMISIVISGLLALMLFLGFFSFWYEFSIALFQGARP